MNVIGKCALSLAVAIGLFGMSTTARAEPAPHLVLEAFPDSVQASLEIYRRQLGNAASTVDAVPFYLIVPTLQRWTPGQTIRVAFRGGNDELYARIEAVADKWRTVGGANIRFSFKDAAGKYLQWTPQDTAYAGEIRIGFAPSAEGLYWSHVGRDSVNAAIDGGGPGQKSMNLAGFAEALPTNWEVIVLHEFGHALGFQHEHQNPEEGCDFRFEDDPGYVLTKDDWGWYTTDHKGRRPGLYTFLGGYKNYWPKSRVDYNLGKLRTTSAYLTGTFDAQSIMKYHFDAFMFVAGTDSPCYTPGENATLSAQDIVGVRKAYPTGASGIALIREEKLGALEELRASDVSSAAVLRDVNRQIEELRLE